MKNKREGKKIHDNNGDAGYRSPCPSHAKRMLYHLSYIPYTKNEKRGKKREEEKEKRKKRYGKKLSNGDSNPGLSRDRRRY